MAYYLKQKINHTEGIVLEKQNSALTALRSIATLDLRSLGLMRIGIAILLIFDLFFRLGDLTAHYTSMGILPLNVLFQYLWNDNYYSLYTMSSSWQLQLIIFLINLGCLICLMVGYRTRLFTIICWFFLLSLHNRNPLIQQAGDDLLRLLLFWGIFLPWGYRYSIDALKIEVPLQSNSYVSFAGFAYVCQIFYMYFFSALLKSSGEWTTEFTALYYALSLDHIVTPLGKWLYLQSGTGILKLMTLIVYYTELVIPFLLLIPFYNRYFRTAFILIIAMFHVGIFMTLYVGLFPMISIVSMIGLIPDLREDFGRAGRRFLVTLDKYRGQGQAYIEQLLVRASGAKIVYVPKEGLITAIIIIFFSIYTFLWNLQTTGRNVPGFQSVRWVGYLFRVDQFWGMFAPAVFKDDGWFVLAGKTRNGKEVDITYNKPLDYEKPEVVADFFKNDRWRKYHENILFVGNNHFRLYYCFYLINKWNAKHDTENQLERLEIIYMKEINLPDYKTAPPKKEVLCDCQITPVAASVVQ